MGTKKGFCLKDYVIIDGEWKFGVLANGKLQYYFK